MVRLAIVLASLAILAGCGFGIARGPGEDRRTPLEKAAVAGDANEVKRLLASGADVNAIGIFGSPLSAATFRRENAEIIGVLLAHGANPDGPRSTAHQCWVTPLAHAANSSDVENTRALLDGGASLQQPACSGFSLGYMQPSIIGYLAQRGLDLKEVDQRGRNALHLAFERPFVPPFATIDYLIGAGVALNGRDASGRTPLAYWREPREFETHWMRDWLFSRVIDDADSKRSRTDRQKITALLERSGATL